MEIYVQHFNWGQTKPKCICSPPHCPTEANVDPLVWQLARGADVRRAGRVILHEICEVLGVGGGGAPLLDPDISDVGPLDLFRYSPPASVASPRVRRTPTSR